MSLARGGQNAGHYYSNITMPQEVALQFVVNAADSGGLGITGLKSNGWVRLVFMHTSGTPGVIDGLTNPNPASGNIIIQLKQNFNVYFGMNISYQPTVTGGTITSLTNHVMYQINSLGTTTAAQWATAGLPAGVTAAVGVSFVAIATASLGGTGNVKAIGNSSATGPLGLEIVGNTNLATNSSIATNGGQYILGQFLNTSAALTNPTDGTVVSLRLFFDRSSVTIDGL